MITFFKTAKRKIYNFTPQFEKKFKLPFIKLNFKENVR